MNRINILDIIRKSKNYDVALLTTFNFEISFFERNILNKLYDNDIRKISLFVDSKEIIKSLDNVNNSYIGKRYYVSPVFLNSSFHPKVILLLGKNKARLIIGSWNLTVSGYYINNEVGNYFDYDENNKENLHLIQAAMKFFIEINEKTDKRDKDLIESIKLYSYYKQESKVDEDIRFITNINQPLISQINEFIIEPVKEINIAVPYYKKISVLETLKENFPKSNIILYIQNKRNTFPIEHKDNYNINLFNKFNDNKSSNFYHGKVFRFITENYSYILYGSANCTEAALLKSANEGGNIESNIIVKGLKEEFDYYFENFCIEEGLEFESEKLIIESTNQREYLFLNNDFNILKFKYKTKKDNLKIIILNKEVKYSYIDNYLQVELDKKILDSLEGIFIVSFYNGEKVEHVSCYINDIKQIKYNRTPNITNEIFKINISPDIHTDSDKYIKERQMLYFQFKPMYDILKEKLDYYIISNEEEDSELITEREDFIDYDYKLSDEILVKQKTLERIFKANRSIFYSFKNHLLSLKTNYNNIKKSENKNNQQVVKQSRIAMSEEKIFARFVFNIIKAMLNKSNINKLDFSYYLECVVTIFDVFNKFMIREKVIDMFDEDEVVEAEHNLIYELTSKFNSEITEEYKEMYLNLVFICIIQTKCIAKKDYNTDYKKDFKNKKLLKIIDNKFNIREDYNKYLETSLGVVNFDEIKIDKDTAILYIESLFDYRTKNQIKELMNRDFGYNYIVEINKSTLLIKINTENIGKYFKLSELTINEIIKFYNNFTDLELIKIEIINDNINPKYLDPAIKIEYTFDRLGEGKQKIISKLGNKRVQRDKNLYLK